MSTSSARAFLQSNVSALEALLARLGDDDELMRANLEEQISEKRLELLTTEEIDEAESASAELFFSGSPVIGSRGIDSEFGSKAISQFQDIVDRVFARRYTARALGRRGIVPGRDNARLFLTSVVHGSFGFRLEEISQQPSMVRSQLKSAVDQASRLMGSFSESDDREFARVVEDLDERTLGSVRSFFQHIRNNEAAFRLVCGSFEKNFDASTIELASERAEITEVSENIETFSGFLQGVLPDARQFEFRSQDGTVVQGRIGQDIDTEAVSSLIREWLEKEATVRMRARTISRRGKIIRTSYFLLDVEELKSE